MLSTRVNNSPYGAVAIQSFQPEDEAELGFEKGDRLLIFNVEERGWLSALRVDLDAGAEGMPYGYIQDVRTARGTHARGCAGAVRGVGCFAALATTGRSSAYLNLLQEGDGQWCSGRRQ